MAGNCDGCEVGVCDSRGKCAAWEKIQKAPPLEDLFSRLRLVSIFLHGFDINNEHKDFTMGFLTDDPDVTVTFCSVFHVFELGPLNSQIFSVGTFHTLAVGR